MKITPILHSDTKAKERIIRLLDLMSVYEPNGFVRLILGVELDYLDTDGVFETEFHIVTAHNDAGALVGYAFYYPEEKTCEFYVLPHWRGKDVGSLMVDKIREEWSGTSVLCAYRGYGGWKNFFDRNFILDMDQFEAISQEAVTKYGDSTSARKALTRNAKLIMAGKMAKHRRELYKASKA
jgi:GNAT superfamily N-acetyltransferase